MPTCRCCERRVAEVLAVTRKGGGTYRRGGRQYDSSVCVPCAEELVRTVTPGHWTNDRFSISSLKWALERHRKSSESD